jgi:hypothetical protein
VALPEFLREDYHRFAFTGDEWLIAYAHLSSTFLVIYPTTFAMAMVLELYLKAYAAFLAGTGVDVTKYGHRIAALYDSLQKGDPSFPAELKLNPRLSAKPLHELDGAQWQCDWFKKLPVIEQADIRKNYEIYLAMEYAADLKYGVSPALTKHSGRVITSAWGALNPWLAKFVCAVRRRIGHPLTPSDDRLKRITSKLALNEPAREYLTKIRDGCK